MTTSTRTPGSIRVATFNVSLSYRKAGQLAGNLISGSSRADNVAKILRAVQPDVVLLNEFDYDDAGRSAELFRHKYLGTEIGTMDSQPLDLPYTFSAPVNSGEPSGMDLNKDGKAAGPEDAYGFGRFPGNFGMVVLSKFPIEVSAVRTFRRFLWRDLPDATQPTDPGTEAPWYSESVWSRLRLSSKSHWVVPIQIAGNRLHLIACHPTPPAFDGPEKRNACRNRDEIRLLTHLISGQDHKWLIDDHGVHGGLPSDARFIICGDLNADPVDGGMHATGIQELLQHPNTQDARPASLGAIEASRSQGRANTAQKGNSASDTADFPDRDVGNLRVDYVMPSSNLKTTASGVFWPQWGAPLADAIQCSDHRLVWTDLQFL